MTNYREQWANGEIEAGTLVDSIESLQKTLKDLKWRIQDTADQLQSYGMGGERLYGLDEWSVPIQNLAKAVSVIDKVLEE